MAVKQSVMRIGVLGGAFDPPHLAHVQVAQAAIEQLSLDCLWIVPTGNAWHKSPSIAPAEHRLEMARLAFRDLPVAAVTDIEIERAGPSYTADTLADLQTQFASDEAGVQSEWFLVMGQDQLNAFERWVRQDEILQRATLAVAPRALSAGDAQKASGVPKWPHVMLEMPFSPASSTAIRTTAQQDHRTVSAPEFLAEAVARYIAQHNLYSESNK